MPVFERILLYVVSLTCAGLLFFNDSRSEPTTSQAAGAGEFHERSTSLGDERIALKPAATNLEKNSRTAPRSDRSPLDNPLDQTRKTNEPDQDTIALKDSQGRTRLELKIDANDQPRIVMHDESGAEVLSLGVGENGTGHLVLRHKQRLAELRSEADGELAFVMRGDQEEELRLSLSNAGEATLLAKGRSPATVALRSSAEGTAEVQLHRGPGTGGPSMSVQKSGDSAIGISNQHREYGPVMHLFEDGLGQLTINGQGSDSGPTLIRTPDGTSIVSVRYPSGQPAASMVSSPAGVSILAVTNTQGTEQASLRTEANGKVSIGVTEAKADEQPPEVQPNPKPLRPPNLEIIRHVPARSPESSESFVANVGNFSH